MLSEEEDKTFAGPCMHGVTFIFSNCKTMDTSTPNITNFCGDEAALNINRFY